MALEQVSAKFTTAVLEEIFHAAGGKDVSLYEFADGFKQGDSFISEMFRLIVSGKKGDGSPLNVHLVIKALPNNLGRRKTFRSTDFFRNECYFYSTCVKQLEKFQAEHNMPSAIDDYFPKCLMSLSDGENDFICLEDLGRSGFETLDRHTTFSLAHCKLVMRCFGHFHGLSLALNKIDPEWYATITDKIQETYYAEKFREWYAPILKKEVLVASDAVSEEYGGTATEKNMKKFMDSSLYSTMMRLAHERGPFSVISHGDCWTPNFMFKYETDANGCKTPCSMKLIDFQLARDSSPALDLSFFMYSCTTQELRNLHFEEIMTTYYKAVCDVLLAAKLEPEKVFSYADLQNEMKRSARFGIGMSIEALPVSLMDDSETVDLNSIQDGGVSMTDIWKIKPLEDPVSRRRLADIFYDATQRGYLD